MASGPVAFPSCRDFKIDTTSVCEVEIEFRLVSVIGTSEGNDALLRLR